MNRAFLMLWVVALGAFVLPGCHVHLHVGEKHYHGTEEQKPIEVDLTSEDGISIDLTGK